MATIRKRGKKYYIEISVNGIRKGASFPTKAEALAWSERTQTELRQNKGYVKNVPFSVLIERYAKEVSPKKRGERWDLIRLNNLLKMPIAAVRLPKLSSQDIAQWRDERLKVVSDSTVLREWSLLSNIFTVAINEWGELQNNPMKGVKRPKEPPPRDRRISEDEIERIIVASGYDYETKPKHIIQIACAAFLFAIETAMRAGEILKLAPEDVDFEKRVAVLRETKNGMPRKVPLSNEAVRLLKQTDFFGVTSSQLEANFQKIKRRAGINDLHFHDTRHEAITRLSKKLDVLSLARVVGHKNLNQLMTYYNESAEDLAKRLD